MYTIIKAQLALILPHKAIVGWYLRENLLIKDKQELYVPPQIQELNTVSLCVCTYFRWYNIDYML